jgi:mRNA interferase RelE/StbE
MWTIEWEDLAKKELKKLDRQIQKEITDFLTHRILESTNPKQFGKLLLYEKFGLWRYRVRDYRIVCRFDDKKLIVLVIQIEHRRDFYE